MAARALKPLFDRVLVQRAEAVAKIGSVYLPDSSAAKLSEGTVVATGPGGRTSTGDTVAMTLKEGDKVLLPEYGGDKVKIDEIEYLLYRETEILGVLAEKK
mmetsp:Transcript_18758/g.29276  ORF Transcript_18758/g.29276 Transcript_18758/m.29276 type:complete len:101 (-) Transcript_18758:50-352(-)